MISIGFVRLSNLALIAFRMILTRETIGRKLSTNLCLRFTTRSAQVYTVAIYCTLCCFIDIFDEFRPNALLTVIGQDWGICGIEA